MSEFKFALEQRVTLPEGNIQGVVSSRQEFIRQPNEYHIHYLLPDLSLAHIVVSEDVLTASQPGDMVLRSEADTSAAFAIAAAHAAGRYEAVCEIERAKEARAAARKAKRNRKRR